MNSTWLKIMAVLPLLFADNFAQKCLKKKSFTKDINFDELGKLDKWWEVKNNINAKPNQTNCLTLRNFQNANFGGNVTTEYVNANFDITETIDNFVKVKPGVYKKEAPTTSTFKTLHQFSEDDSKTDGSSVIVKRNQLIANYRVNWFTDYKDIIIMNACTESGNTLWSIFTSTPTPSRRYKFKMTRILKRLGINVDDMQDTVCQEIE